MDKNYTWAWVVLALLIGGLLTYGVFPRTVEVEKLVPQIKEVKVEVPVEKIVEKNVTVEKKVADAGLYLLTAQKDAWEELDNDDDFLTCGNHEYDEDEISITRISEWGYTWLDNDEYNVTYEAKFKFDDSDETPCRETRNVNVHYEEGEDPEVSWSTISTTN